MNEVLGVNLAYLREFQPIHENHLSSMNEALGVNLAYLREFQPIHENTLVKCKPGPCLGDGVELPGFLDYLA